MSSSPAKNRHREQANRLHQTFAGFPPDKFPLIAAHAAEMVAGDGEERLRFAIDVVVDGVVARAARATPPARSKGRAQSRTSRP